MPGLGLSLGFSGGPGGSAISGGTQYNDANIVFSGATEGGIGGGGTTGSTAGSNTWLWLAALAGVAAAAWYFARKMKG